MKKNWHWWLIFAVCFIALVISTILILPSLLSEDTDTADKIDKRYKNIGIFTTSDAIIWPWEDLAEAERPYEVEINGAKYEKHSSRTVSEELVGNKIGAYNLVGYNGVTQERPSIVCDIYKLKNINQTEYVTAKIADNYYFLKNAVYDPPQTLGELFKRVDLSQFVKLEHFSENSDGPAAKHFALNDDKYVWEVLSNCKDATYIDQDQAHWHMYEREFISFKISSEALDIYKQGLAVTEDGYLWTNAFDWGYLYYIGEETSEKIIKHAKENSKKAEYEPYSDEKYIYGKVIEITDEYFIVDDSILCKKESDGITYKILLNDIRISRCVGSGIVKVGDTVQVTYRGQIDKENSNTISDATSARCAYISQAN